MAKKKYSIISCIAGGLLTAWCVFWGIGLLMTDDYGNAIFTIFIFLGIAILSPIGVIFGTLGIIKDEKPIALTTVGFILSSWPFLLIVIPMVKSYLQVINYVIGR